MWIGRTFFFIARPNKNLFAVCLPSVTHPTLTPVCAQKETKIRVQDHLSPFPPPLFHSRSIATLTFTNQDGYKHTRPPPFLPPPLLPQKDNDSFTCTVFSRTGTRSSEELVQTRRCSRSFEPSEPPAPITASSTTATAN